MTILTATVITGYMTAQRKIPIMTNVSIIPTTVANTFLKKSFISYLFIILILFMNEFKCLTLTPSRMEKRYAITYHLQI